MSRIKPAEVRFYLDADLLGLGHVLSRLRPEFTYPGDPGAVVHKRQRGACQITSAATKDSSWIPEIARRGWLILTRDRHILEHRLEVAAVRDHGAKLVVLTSEDARSTFAQLEVVMCRWRDIERSADEKAPVIYAVTRTAMPRLDLN